MKNYQKMEIKAIKKGLGCLPRSTLLSLTMLLCALRIDKNMGVILLRTINFTPSTEGTTSEEVLCHHQMAP